jgi:hypothetical protein
VALRQGLTPAAERERVPAVTEWRDEREVLFIREPQRARMALHSSSLLPSIVGTRHPRALLIVLAWSRLSLLHPHPASQRSVSRHRYMG